MCDSRSGKCSRKWKCFVTIFYKGKGGGGHVSFQIRQSVQGNVFLSNDVKET